MRVILESPPMMLHVLGIKYRTKQVHRGLQTPRGDPRLVDRFDLAVADRLRNEQAQVLHQGIDMAGERRGFLTIFIARVRHRKQIVDRHPATPQAADRIRHSSTDRPRLLTIRQPVWQN